MPRPLARPARGASLVELLVGMLLGLMVLGIALQLMLVARARYQRLADDALIEDRGTRALQAIAQAVHQAGWITDTPVASPVRRWPSAGAPLSLLGSDDCGRPQKIPALNCQSEGEQHSDALMTRFAGRSPDAATYDCAGFGIRERIGGDEDPRLGSMLLFISVSDDDEHAPRLMCRSFAGRNANAPAAGQTHEIVRGIETLQLLYTIAPTSTSPGATKPARAMQPEDWYRVRQVHAAIVVRADHYAFRPPPSDTITLFPELGPVPGARTEDVEFRPQGLRRSRARFTATFSVRNPLHCEADAC
jgi:type IV pilus assembly protein PilW